MALIKKSDLVESNILADLNKEVKDLTANLKKLQDQTRAVNKSGSGAEAKERITITKDLTSSTKKLKNALTAEERVKQQILRANAKLAESRTKAAKDLALVRQKTLQANKALREQAKANIGVRKSFAGIGKQLLGAAGLIGGFTALIGVLKDAFKIYVNFAKESSRLAAILGKNKDEIKSLTNQAKELGSTTAFTASQVIELQTELAKLGFTLQEIEASTPGILALASATGTDLARSAELAGATLRIFNLNASEMSRVTDVLALSTSKSSLNMEKLAVILPTVGKTAQIAGVSLEKTAALAGTLTDRGLDASSAATSLRNIFLELSKKGITWNEAMTKINESTDKNKTSMDLFGKRAAAAGVVLSETAESTDELTIALENADGAAQDMADTMLNNLAGDITIAQSAWEGFILSLEDGEGFLSKFLRGAVQDFTEFLGLLTTFNETDIENKLKIIANAALNLFDKAFLPLVKVLEALGVEVPRFRFEIENTSKGTDEFSWTLGQNTKELDKNTDAINKNKDAEIEIEKSVKKTTKAKLDQIAAISEADEAAIDSELEDQLLLNQEKLDNEQAYQDEKAKVQDKAREDELKKEIDKEAALLSIRQAALKAFVQLASDIYSAYIDEQLAQSKEIADKNIEITQGEADSKIQVLQNQLDKGLITEEEFARQSAIINKDLADEIADIEREQRIESAKADKKKAIFDIGIATIVASIKALPNLIASAAILAIGAIQAAAVAATPIPKFAEGGEVGGKSHKQGGTVIEAEKGEFVVNKSGYSNAPDIVNMVNDGVLTDSNIKGLTQDNNMLIASLLMQGNKYSNDIITLMGNMGWTYNRDGQTIINRADGSKIERFNI